MPMTTVPRFKTIDDVPEPLQLPLAELAHAGAQPATSVAVELVNVELIEPVGVLEPGYRLTAEAIRLLSGDAPV
jgi:hypothetical protein